MSRPPAAWSRDGLLRLLDRTPKGRDESAPEPLWVRRHDEYEDYNTQIIREFRANEGHVAGMWDETPLLLLNHTGARSGERRVNPVAYLSDGGSYLLWAANGGAPTSPGWYYNLKAQPNVTIEVGSKTIDVVASEASGQERERLYRTLVERYPQIAELKQKARRVIPLILLTPR